MTHTRYRIAAAGAVAAVMAVMAVAVAFAARGPVRQPTAIIGHAAPDFTLKSSHGENVRLGEYRGQVVLVNFWGRSAPESRREMPALERLANSLHADGLVVLGVSVDADARRAGEFATAMAVSYPVLFDTRGQLGRAYAIAALPMTVLVDRDGVIRYAHVGFTAGDDAVYADRVRELLRE